MDPIKPKLKPPGTKRLKLKCDVLLSGSSFKFNLRRYTKGGPEAAAAAAAAAAHLEALEEMRREFTRAMLLQKRQRDELYARVWSSSTT